MTGRFPDAEKVMIALAAPFGYACQTLPLGADGKFDRSKMPIIWVARTGGARDDITDRPLLQIGVLADTRADATRIGEDVRDAVLASGGSRAGGALIDTAREVTGVQELPDIDPLNRLIQASYQLSFRRQFN